jgi:Ni/Co efflux regulator RcnB
MQRQTNVCDKAKGASSVEVTRREMGLGAELDRLIAKRHDRRVAEEGARPAPEAWMESERHHDARRREESRREWREYHLAAAARHTTLLVSLIAQHHEREAEKYLSAEGAA